MLATPPNKNVFVLQMRILQMNHGTLSRNREGVGFVKNKKKSIIKTVRFTQSEYQKIMAAARDQNMIFSAYVQKMLGNNPQYDIELRRRISRLASEINYIGHNINQIVKNNNSGLYSDFDKQRLMEYMRIINEKVDLLMAQNGNQ